jgi:hypothetical protein
MFESLILLILIALFGFGYRTRSYVGASVPGLLFVSAVVLYSQSTPTGDEVNVQPAIYAVASGLGVLIYLVGVALGRRSHRRSRKAA